MGAVAGGFRHNTQMLSREAENPGGSLWSQGLASPGTSATLDLVFPT